MIKRSHVYLISPTLTVLTSGLYYCSGKPTRTAYHKAQNNVMHSIAVKVGKLKCVRSSPGPFPILCSLFPLYFFFFVFSLFLSTLILFFLPLFTRDSK